MGQGGPWGTARGSQRPHVRCAVVEAVLLAPLECEPDRLSFLQMAKAGQVDHREVHPRVAIWRQSVRRDGTPPLLRLEELHCSNVKIVAELARQHTHIFRDDGLNRQRRAHTTASRAGHAAGAPSRGLDLLTKWGYGGTRSLPGAAPLALHAGRQSLSVAAQQLSKHSGDAIQDGVEIGEVTPLMPDAPVPSPPSVTLGRYRDVVVETVEPDVYGHPCSPWLNRRAPAVHGLSAVC